jgi:hypothetical protein
MADPVPALHPEVLVQSAVIDYFSGERQEMLLILGGSLLVAALALWLWVATRTGFAAAFAITVLAAAIALLALLGLVLSGRGWIHGVAAGLLMLVVAQVLIDHYSEHRAADYLRKLEVAKGRES